MVKLETMRRSRNCSSSGDAVSGGVIPVELRLGRAFLASGICLVPQLA